MSGDQIRIRRVIHRIPGHRLSSIAGISRGQLCLIEPLLMEENNINGQIRSETTSSTQAGLGQEHTEDLPRLLVDDRPLRERSDEARQTLIRSNEPPVLFQRGGLLVDVCNNGFRVVGIDVLRRRLARIADFIKWSFDRHGFSQPTNCNPPEDIIRDILCRSHQRDFPAVQGIVQWPIWPRTEAFARSPDMIHPLK